MRPKTVVYSIRNRHVRINTSTILLNRSSRQKIAIAIERTIATFRVGKNTPVSKNRISIRDLFPDVFVYEQYYWHKYSHCNQECHTRRKDVIRHINSRMQ